MIRLLVVDDSAFVRKALCRVLSSVSDVGEVLTAGSGRDAIAMLDEARPDVITLDVDMPDMDGRDVLREILRRQPKLPVIMLSAFTTAGAEATIDALSAGAVDFIDKTRLNVLDFDCLRATVLEKVRQWAGRSRPHPTQSPAGPADDPLANPRDYDVCAIGASTGGPAALQRLLEAAPAGLPWPVVVAQHMPAGFTHAFAERLSSLSSLWVREARTGDRLVRRQVLVAPGGLHLRVRADKSVEVLDEAGQAPFAPSVDVLFTSAARVYGSRVIAVLLTGMGDDGALGMCRVKSAGGLTLAQDEASSAVYGMPRAAARRGCAMKVMSLDEMSNFFFAAARRYQEET